MLAEYTDAQERVMRRLMTLIAAAAAASVAVLAQTPAPARPASPAGSAAIQVGWKASDDPGARAKDGKWIEVTYGRPIKRGRADLFGSGADYGKGLNATAPVWRAGANVSTRLKTEVPLVFGTTTVPAGEYSLFIDLKGPANWTMILSSHQAQATYDPNDKVKLWGSYGYTPDKDVARIPMKVEALPYSVEELTYVFTDVTAAGATLRLMWDTVTASVTFKAGA
jgi:hypothetical protein